MKKEIADRWIAELESGNYKQTTNALCMINGEEKSFCCLGVLCEIAKDELNLKTELGSLTAGKQVVFYNDSPACIPNIVRDWADMKSRNGLLLSGGSLATLNDDGHTFKQIAVIIRENWELL